MSTVRRVLAFPRYANTPDEEAQDWIPTFVGMTDGSLNSHLAQTPQYAPRIGKTCSGVLERNTRGDDGGKARAAEAPTRRCSFVVSPLSMLVYAKGLLGGGGGPRVVTGLDSRLRENDEL
jgi:hypothetical protein